MLIYLKCVIGHNDKPLRKIILFIAIFLLKYNVRNYLDGDRLCVILSKKIK